MGGLDRYLLHGMNAPAPRPFPTAFLIGSTASGKSSLAMALCERFGAELFSLDSMQVYRRMDIGTAKPTKEERAAVPHHLIDLVEPNERYDVQRFVRDFEAAEQDCAARGVKALAVGGTGLYLQALVRGLFEGPAPDPDLRARLKERVLQEGMPALHAELENVDAESAARIHPHDEKRVLRALEVLEQTGKTMSDWQKEWSEEPVRKDAIVGIAHEVSVLDERIRARTRAMLRAGWAEEARGIRDSCGFGPTAVQALGYAEALALADGELNEEQAEERIYVRTRQFARRQRTWFRRFEQIHWLEGESSDPGRADLDALARRFGWI